MIISLGLELPQASSNLPGDFGRAGLSAELYEPAGVSLFGLAPDDAYRAVDVAITAVGSYPAVSPLPEPPEETKVSNSGHRRFVFCGAGVGSLRLDVIQRPCPWSPDFPPAEPARRAITRVPPARQLSIKFVGRAIQATDPRANLSVPAQSARSTIARFLHRSWFVSRSAPKILHQLFRHVASLPHRLRPGFCVLRMV